MTKEQYTVTSQQLSVADNGKPAGQAKAIPLDTIQLELVWMLIDFYIARNVSEDGIKKTYELVDSLVGSIRKGIAIPNKQQRPTTVGTTGNPID